MAIETILVGSLIILILSIICYFEKEKELAKLLFQAVIGVNIFYFGVAFLIIIGGLIC